MLRNGVYKKAESARFFARFLPVFLLKKRPLFARFFTKLSPFEEIATLFFLQILKDHLEKSAISAEVSRQTLYFIHILLKTLLRDHY